MNDRRPRFSVVIPTRERAETLRVTLATCLDQDFDDYEIVVCDNAGGGATREVVDAARSGRIRYHRSETPLAMSANWELAVSLASGDYVTVVGDDDALMPYALRELDRLVEEHDRPAAVHWHRAVYAWPTIAVESEANFLLLPAMRTLRILDGSERLAAAARWEVGADRLPTIYAAAVRSDLIAEHRRIAGRLFPNIYPDIYSAYAFAYLADRYVSVGVPMGIAGLSGASNGVATLLQDGSGPIAMEFERLNRAAGLVPHPTVPDLPLIPVHADDCFQHARDLLFPNDPVLVLDRRRMAERYLAAITDTDVPARQAARAAIRASLADRPDLVQWFDAEAPDPAPAPGFRMKPTRFGIHGEMLAVDTSRFGVEDVAGAVRLSCDLLGLDGEPIAYDVVTPDPHRSAQQRAASSSARLRHRLRGVPAAVPARVRRVLGRASSSR